MSSPGSRDGKKFEHDSVEHWTGSNWIDGKPIFRKVVNFGAMPNAANKDVAHGIPTEDIDWIVSCEGVAADRTFGIFLPLSYPTAAARIELFVIGSTIRITTDSDFTNWDECFIILEYTKT